MPERYRIQLYWSPRQESVENMGGRLLETQRRLALIHPQVAGFVADHDEADHPVTTVEECVTAVRRGEQRWQFGAEERIAYQVTLFVKPVMDPPVSLTLTGGIEPEHVGGLFAPNQLTLWVRRDAPGEVARTEVLHALIAALAECWQADFGYVGTPTFPAPAVPLMSVGEPPVGWMTFLSKNRPPPPTHLPTPAVGYPAGSVGTIVVAHPKLYRDHIKEHREAIEAVRQALAHAGVLKPA